MAFKLKTKTKPVTEPETTDTIETPAQTKTKTPAETVDAIGDLIVEENRLNADLMEDPRMIKLLGKRKERSRLEKVLTEQACTEKNIAEKLTIIGTKHAAEIAAAPNKRSICDKDVVVDTLEEIQEGLAIELATFTLKDLDKYLNPMQQEKCITSEHKGARKIRIEPI